MGIIDGETKSVKIAKYECSFCGKIYEHKEGDTFPEMCPHCGKDTWRTGKTE